MISKRSSVYVALRCLRRLWGGMWSAEVGQNLRASQGERDIAPSLICMHGFIRSKLFLFNDSWSYGFLLQWQVCFLLIYSSVTFKETQHVIITLNAPCKNKAEWWVPKEAGTEMKGHCSLLPLNEQLFAEVQTESWEPITPGGHCFSVPRLSRSPAEVLRVPEQPANSIFSFACGGGGHLSGLPPSQWCKLPLLVESQKKQLLQLFFIC